MKYLKGYDTNSEQSTDIINLYLPYVTYTRDTGKIYADGGYISDGLVFQLDGIQKGHNANAWTDLVGDHVFTNNGCTAIDKGWQISNTTSTYNSLRNTDTLSFPQTTYTIEVCFYSTKATGLVFAPMGANNISFGMVADKRIIWNNSSTAEWTISSGTFIGKNYFSVNSVRALYNVETQMTKGNNNNWITGTYNGIGARSNNATYSFNGIIYAIRIYNRQLSYDEMKHNQQVDTKRFF